MASGILDADKINKEKCKWGEGNLVYSRRHKKTNTAVVAVVSPAKPISPAIQDQTSTNPDDNNLQTEQTSIQADDYSSESLPENETENGVVRPLVTYVEERVKIYLDSSTSKEEIKELKGKLEGELSRVLNLFRKLEDKEAEATHYSSLVVANVANVANGVNDDDDGSYSQLQYSGNGMVDRRSLVRANSEMGTDYMDRRALTRVHSEIGSDLIDRRALMRVNSEVSPYANQEFSRFRDLSVSVGEYVEKEKRTPKANQYYRNSDFLLGKDRLPPESNKRHKSNGGRKSDYSAGLERHKNQVFRSCNNLLQRLMKHKHGWVFNEPVNAKLLGLRDYHDIIKHPMDLGTVKSRLAQGFYKTPGEFAEDVRLTFHNAMTYNPQGQDVHIMAAILSNIFEERWVVIESDWRYGTVHESGGTPTFAPTPTSKKVDQFRALDRSQSMGLPFMSRPKPPSFAPVSRVRVPKKPKANDLNKRDMTYEEKQKLSSNLQSLPSEKLDNIVQIIKKSNTSLSQNDDEIEVDIDSVDAETLWELDRFVLNYRKNLSKHKRKAELSQQARALAGTPMLENPAAPIPEAPKDKRADEMNPATNPPNQGDNRGTNSRSSSSSSSSSDSGSSSSDSDSDSSSDESNAGH